MKDDPPAPPTSPVAATGGSTKRLSAQEVADLYQRYGREMRAFLAGVLRRTDLAEDALQQTFQRAAESGGAAARETIRGWLFQVAYREALLIRRREERRARHHHAFSTTTHHVQYDGSAVEALVTAEEIERLRDALTELPAEQREVVERRIAKEETFAEIAADLGAPLGTVLTRMRLALEKLRKRLHDV